MHFHARLELHGRTATGIEVPTDVLERLAAGKRPAVSVSVNGYRYTTSVGAMGGRSLIPVSADVRERAGIAAGDELDVEVELDTAPRTVAVPAVLDEALDREPDLRRSFAALSNSRKQRLVLPIEQAKTDATRERNAGKAIEALREGRA
jgi:bifunctional DNA-binding transcriptional regulator/antitoxin component of YhaV-PrlF toxin-antitoxin module